MLLETGIYLAFVMTIVLAVWWYVERKLQIEDNREKLKRMFGNF